MREGREGNRYVQKLAMWLERCANEIDRMRLSMERQKMAFLVGKQEERMETLAPGLWDILCIK